MPSRETPEEIAKVMHENGVPTEAIANVLLGLGFDRQRVRRIVTGLPSGNRAEGARPSLASLESRLSRLESAVLRWGRDEGAGQVLSRIRTLEARVDGLIDVLARYLPFIVDHERS
ncbi:TPA: hypothetical protein EYP44_02455 [Candidatus Bathyarchaeota archaeon]|nr:hypothetical protein [Candidatus Bathyarchaeota archaeon]